MFHPTQAHAPDGARPITINAAVDLIFPVSGGSLATVSRHALGAALADFAAARVPDLTAALPFPDGRWLGWDAHLTSPGSLVLRVCATAQATWASLGGADLRLTDGTCVHLGAPTIAPVAPAAWLVAPAVVLRPAAGGRAAARRQVQRLLEPWGLRPSAVIVVAGAAQSAPDESPEAVFAVQLAPSSPTEALALQWLGLGPGRAQGIGFVHAQPSAN